MKRVESECGACGHTFICLFKEIDLDETLNIFCPVCGWGKCKANWIQSNGNDV